MTNVMGILFSSSGEEAICAAIRKEFWQGTSKTCILARASPLERG
jgi:hypothetical protein